MPNNEFLSDRVAQFLNEKSIPFITKKMMGGLLYMVDDKMFVGVNKDELMARINPILHQESILKNGCKETNFTGRPMKGFVFLTDEATDLDDDLYYWLQLALDFNPFAKSSKKK